MYFYEGTVKVFVVYSGRVGSNRRWVLSLASYSGFFFLSPRSMYARPHSWVKNWLTLFW